MTRLTTITLCLLLILAAFGCENGDKESASAVNDQDQSTVALGVTLSNVDEGDDEVITFDQCPAGVQATIQARLDGGTIREIERTTDHGEVLYEVDVLTGDGIVEFDVAEDGTFRRYENDGEDSDLIEDDAFGDNDDDDGDNNEAEEEEEIPLDQVPDLIKSAALNAVPGIVLEEAAREVEGDEVIYELEGEADGKEYEIEVSEDGEVLEVELDEDDGGDDDADDEDDEEDGEDDDDH